MNSSRERDRSPLPPLAVLSGVRTPFAKAWGAMADVPADELGQTALVEAVSRSGLSLQEVDEVVFGNVAGPAESSNVARVIALRSGVPQDRPAHTVNRNCASGMESVISAWQIIREGRADVVVAGGTESMSQVPLLWRPEMQQWLLAFRKGTWAGKLKLMTRLRPAHFQPVAALEMGLTDPVCGLNMGETAEVLAREFGISREEQDAFALRSHLQASAAWDRCFLSGEVTPVTWRNGSKESRIERDVGPRGQQTPEALARLRPLFDPRGEKGGTVTAGNSCPITDGAAALTLLSAERAKAAQMKPLGYIRGYAIAGCDPRRMGLGPVYAIRKLLASSGLSLRDFEQFEINEAFAAQVLACQRAMESRTFAEREWGESEPIGEIDPERLNVNGGAIALGHPVGVSGTRLILTLLRSLQETGRQRALAALCVGGGQGVAVWVERTLEGAA